LCWWVKNNNNNTQDSVYGADDDQL